MPVNGSYSISNFFIPLYKTLFTASKLQLYLESIITESSITFINCQCNVFWPCVAIITAAAIKKDYRYRNNCGIWLHAGDLEHSLMKEKKGRSSYVFLLIFMFCFSRFRNLKDANWCMFLRCISTRNLLICSWHDMTLSQFLQ